MLAEVGILARCRPEDVLLIVGVPIRPLLDWDGFLTVLYIVHLALRVLHRHHVLQAIGIRKRRYRRHRNHGVAAIFGDLLSRRLLEGALGCHGRLKGGPEAVLWHYSGLLENCNALEERALATGVPKLLVHRVLLMQLLRLFEHCYLL